MKPLHHKHNSCFDLKLYIPNIGLCFPFLLNAVAPKERNIYFKTKRIRTVFFLIRD